MSTELVDSVQEARTVSRDEFAATVEREAEDLKAEIEDGTFDNPQAIVGLEYELYGVDEDAATLRRMPRPLLELVNFEGELSLHTAEFHTNPQPLNGYGLRAPGPADRGPVPGDSGPDPSPGRTDATRQRRPLDRAAGGRVGPDVPDRQRRA